jgi:hypothetical protein
VWRIFVGSPNFLQGAHLKILASQMKWLTVTAANRRGMRVAAENVL